MNVLKDETGQLFYIKRDRACYLHHVAAVPKHVEATPDESLRFERSHKAVWEVVQDNIPLCYWMCYKMRAAADYDELVHEVGIPTILECIPKWRQDKGRFSTYLGRALHNRYVGYLRSRKRVVMEARERGAPSDEFRKLEDRDHVQCILNRLNAYDRNLLVLRFWKGMSLDEIADIVGLAKCTVSNHLRNALERARKL